MLDVVVKLVEHTHRVSRLTAHGCLDSYFYLFSLQNAYKLYAYAYDIATMLNI